MSNIIPTLYNGTPHAIGIVSAVIDVKTGGATTETVNYPSDGSIRLTSDPIAKPAVPSWMDYFGFNFIAAPTFSGIEGLPEYKEGLVLLVSMPVGNYIAAHPESWNGPVIGPDTGPMGVIRDEKGNITGTKNIVVYK